MYILFYQLEKFIFLNLKFFYLTYIFLIRKINIFLIYFLLL